MPEPYQPVDHLAVFRLVPLNSSSNLSVQSPGTPVGIGVTACGCSVAPRFRLPKWKRRQGRRRYQDRRQCMDLRRCRRRRRAPGRVSPLGGAGRRQPPWHEEGCHADNYGADEGCLDHGVRARPWPVPAGARSLMVLLLRRRRSLLCHEVALVLRWSRDAKQLDVTTPTSSAPRCTMVADKPPGVRQNQSGGQAQRPGTPAHGTARPDGSCQQPGYSRHPIEGPVKRTLSPITPKLLIDGVGGMISSSL